ncbi:hypothetical protein M427DRAFT_38490 [Gonapodya prolifera JEL478]|uniref:Oxidation resistance protein 1 n=1 Tax=Gonapodya prolifera (strain JEL478) TaxID=1344416 RepID=A0A138ZYY3_GONPJ|nr:hypothetical protein M427DRAFT_38490 [Gonapodya prolifera JEL478]|eukprot:KXS09717.1 hypothetical protein M427DRAFT_38490 [Gonapodya prolifera JEL478]
MAGVTVNGAKEEVKGERGETKANGLKAPVLTVDDLSHANDGVEGQPEREREEGAEMGKPPLPGNGVHGGGGRNDEIGGNRAADTVGAKEPGYAGRRLADSHSSASTWSDTHSLASTHTSAKSANSLNSSILSKFKKIFRRQGNAQQQHQHQQTHKLPARSSTAPNSATLMQHSSSAASLSSNTSAAKAALSSPVMAGTVPGPPILLRRGSETPSSSIPPSSPPLSPTTVHDTPPAPKPRSILASPSLSSLRIPAQSPTPSPSLTSPTTTSSTSPQVQVQFGIPLHRVPTTGSTATSTSHSLLLPRPITTAPAGGSASLLAHPRANSKDRSTGENAASRWTAVGMGFGLPMRRFATAPVLSSSAANDDGGTMPSDSDDSGSDSGSETDSDTSSSLSSQSDAESDLEDDAIQRPPPNQASLSPSNATTDDAASVASHPSDIVEVGDSHDLRDNKAGFGGRGRGGGRAGSDLSVRGAGRQDVTVEAGTERKRRRKKDKDHTEDKDNKDNGDAGEHPEGKPRHRKHHHKTKHHGGEGRRKSWLLGLFAPSTDRNASSTTTARHLSTHSLAPPPHTTSHHSRSRSVSPTLFLRKSPANVSVPASGVVRLKNGVVVDDGGGGTSGTEKKDKGKHKRSHRRHRAHKQDKEASALSASRLFAFLGVVPPRSPSPTPTTSSSSSHGDAEDPNFDAATSTSATTATKSLAVNLRGHRAVSVISAGSRAAGSGRRGSVAEDDLPPVVLLGRNVDEEEEVVCEGVAEAIRPHLPPRLRDHAPWQLAYSLSQHGSSLRTMYSLLEEKGPLVFAVRDENGAIFGGFASEGVERRDKGKGYVGTGESFLWRVLPEPRLPSASKPTPTLAPTATTSTSTLPPLSPLSPLLQPPTTPVSGRRMSLDERGTDKERADPDPRRRGSSGGDPSSAGLRGNGGGPGGPTGRGGRIRFAEGTRAPPPPPAPLVGVVAGASPIASGGPSGGFLFLTTNSTPGTTSQPSPRPPATPGPTPIQVQVHPATGLNEYYLAATWDGIQVGGGDGGVAFYLDGGLETGHSDGRNETYDMGDMALGALYADADEPAETRDFTIVGLEWWWFDLDGRSAVEIQLDAKKAGRTVGEAMAERREGGTAGVKW